MLLVIDIGNTNTVAGLFEGRDLRHHWRFESARSKTADEYGVLLRALFQAAGVAPGQVSGAIVACVVPPLQEVFADVCRRWFSVEPLAVGPGIKTRMPVRYDNPREVGADRIVNAVAAFHEVGGPLIVVDFGTATTFDCVGEKGEYLGGAITPGIGIALEALVTRTSKLPRVEIARPKRLVGKTTVEAIQAGMFWGYVGLVDGLVGRLKEEMGGVRQVIATGGLAPLISSETRAIDRTDEHLTLKGLRILHEWNSDADG